MLPNGVFAIHVLKNVQNITAQVTKEGVCLVKGHSYAVARVSKTVARWTALQWCMQV